MTEFQRATAGIDELGEICEQLVNVPESTCLDPDLIDLFERFGKRVDQVANVMARLHMRATETDPNRQTYGPTMRTRVLKLVEKYDTIWKVYDEELKPRFEHLSIILQKKRLMEQAQHEQLEGARKDQEFDRHQRQLLSRERERENQMAIQEQTEMKRKQRLQEVWKQAGEQLSKNREDRLHKASILADQVRSTGFRTVLLQGLYLLAQEYPSVPEFQAALEPFCNLIYSISRNPDLIFLRVLRVRNAQFQEAFGKKSGCAQILSAFGFLLRTYEDAAYQVMLADESWLERRRVDEDLFPKHAHVDLYWILPEPDSERDFLAWSTWRVHLRNCEKLMATLQAAGPRNMTLQDWLRHVVTIEENIS